mmetsp:Transcript_14814/g.27766  ORF Transcript_14814/g.27766 Transcript_14814/m.27766 type:complete len:137 (-) Transcript_14814:14-424(-)
MARVFSNDTVSKFSKMVVGILQYSSVALYVGDSVDSDDDATTSVMMTSHDEDDDDDSADNASPVESSPVENSVNVMTSSGCECVHSGTLSFTFWLRLFYCVADTEMVMLKRTVEGRSKKGKKGKTTQTLLLASSDG